MGEGEAGRRTSSRANEAEEGMHKLTLTFTHACTATSRCVCVFEEEKTIHLIKV